MKKRYVSSLIPHKKPTFYYQCKYYPVRVCFIVTELILCCKIICQKQQDSSD